MFFAVFLATSVSVFGAVPDSSAPVVKEASRMLVLDNGRIKPLATYARYTLYAFSGRYAYRGESAVAWLCSVLFNRPGAEDAAVFLINDPAVADAMGIPARKDRRYSLSDLLPGVDKLERAAWRAALIEPKERSGVESELLRLDMNLRRYAALSGSGLPAGSGSPGSPPEARGAMVVPLERQGAVIWLTPREAMDSCGDDCRIAAACAAAATAYRESRFGSCADRLRAINRLVLNLLGRQGIHPAVGLEILYNEVNPFFWSMALYLVALAAFFAALAGGRRAWSLLGGSATAAGLLLHTAGLAARMAIMHRPPIASFYETFVVVAWVGVILGLLLWRFTAKTAGLFLAAAMGSALLALASRFGADGDTMGALAPVLNSNFWLTLHIITIATGYAGCMGAGLIGHIVLLRQAFPSRSTVTTAAGKTDLDGAMWTLLAVGMTFTTVGTVLGGMWAEQAWGRFWGWDPKENGALIIILWCAMLFHARRAGFFTAAFAAFGVGFAVPLIMLAWVGVNLLGVGMHSYGFTASGAKALFFTLGADAIFMTIMAARLFYLSAKKPS
jgi:ABC-type transport system involved in cytochrome c biogenesis permease subunit